MAGKQMNYFTVCHFLVVVWVNNFQ